MGVAWAPFVGTFLARISRGRTVGQFVLSTLFLPALWGMFFVGVFGASQIRMQNMAEASVEVGSHIVNLYNQSYNDRLFDHLASFGGFPWTFFMTIIVLVSIIVFFVTSSDSASFVIDMMAANGIENPPVTQKIFWALTEGAAACALLLSGSASGTTASIDAVKNVPIVLGMPLSILLMWTAWGIVTMCKEDLGELKISRRHFRFFLFHVNRNLVLAILFPFLPLGRLAAKLWNGSPLGWTMFFGVLWSFVPGFLLMAVLEPAFVPLSAAAFVLLAVSTTLVRASVREYVGIGGGLVPDICAVFLAFPFAVAQAASEMDVGDRIERKLTDTVPVFSPRV